MQNNRNVAQLVRASPRQGEGRRFESDHSYQTHKICDANYVCAGSSRYFCDSDHKKSIAGDKVSKSRESVIGDYNPRT